MAKWIKSGTSTVLDTATAGITSHGTYYLLKNEMDCRRPALFGARVAVAGHTATVQLFAEVATAKTNIGAALVPTNGNPTMLTDEITLTGTRGIVVSGLTGTVYPEVDQ